MSGSKYNNSGFGLSLNGSQVGTPSSSARQHSGRSSARGSQSSLFGTGAREKTTDTSKTRPRSNSYDRSTPKSQRSAKGQGPYRQNGSSSSAVATAAAAGDADDFLALFDSTTQPKILQPKSKVMRKDAQPKKAWGSAQNSARSGASATSKQSRATSKFSHSVFEPMSARTNSTDGEDTYRDDYLPTNYEPGATANSARSTKRTNHTPMDRGDHNLHLAIPRSGGRNTGHGENDLVHNSQYESSDKATKLNSIANNIASSPSTKAPFQGMENSCQNIKHKLVNQVKQSSQDQRSAARINAEDYIKKCNMAATKIQRWFRRHNRASAKAGEAALRRLLESKKKEKTEEIERELQDPVEERKRKREERLQQERLEAIEELKKKREAKRQRNQDIVEHEMRFLQESGVVSKTPSKKSNVKKKPSSKTKSSPGLSPKQEEIVMEVQSISPRSPASNAKDVDSGEQENGHEARDIDASSHVGTKTNLADLMETIRQLEDGVMASSRNEKPEAWQEEVEKNSDDNATGDKDNIKKSGFLSNEKLRNVMSYLEEVDAADRLSEIDQELSKSTDEFFNPPLLVPSYDELAALEQASANAAEVTNSMLSQKMELEETKRTIKMLQKALSQQRELNIRNVKETQKDMKKMLAEQRGKYEQIIQGKDAFIEELMEGKQALLEKSESLAKEIRTIDEKYKEQLKRQERDHEEKLKRVKYQLGHAEKIRRENWEKEQRKKIKESTINGIKPELVALTSKHMKEIQTLKAQHERDLLETDERTGGRYVRMIEEVRDKLAKEKEAACARERELARQTYEKKIQHEEEMYQQQRSRLYAEVQEEKNRLAQQASRQRIEHDKLQRQLEDAQSSAMAAMREEFEKSRDDQERRHAAEIKQHEEKLKLEKEAWEENLLLKQETWAKQKERELRERVIKERDEEIELVIKQLEKDDQSAREKDERASENRIKRIRDKYESEVKELEQSERLTMEKYNHNKAQLAEYEGENERLKVTMRQKDREVEEIKNRLEHLNNERDHVSDVIRQEFVDRIVATEEENKRIKNEMSEAKARLRLETEKCKSEIEIVIKQKEEELDAIHKRVKEAMHNKDEIIKNARADKMKAEKRANHLEGLLDQQRKQFVLGKK